MTRTRFLLLSGLILSFAAIGNAAPTVKWITAHKGSNTGGAKTRMPANQGVGPAFAGLKAQNRLSPAMNQTLVKEKSGVGGSLINPGYKNGVVDTLPYFNSWFVTGYKNSVYTYSMIGHSPKLGGTTSITNRVLPLFVELVDSSGNPVADYDPTGGFTCGVGSDINLTVHSPIYDGSMTYPGGSNLPADTGQIVDTTQRASFTGVRTNDWHTPMSPPQNGDCSTSFIYGVQIDPSAWVTLINGGGMTVGYAVDINVISDVFEQVLNIENSVFGLPNSVLPIILTDAITAYDPSNNSCCVLGYHTAEPGKSNPNGILVWLWASFQPLTNNIFGPAEGDILTLSHEVTEMYNDPFVNTAVSPWVDGAVAFAQANLETGDVIEAMSDADRSYPVLLGSYLYHVQNEALLPWFTRTPISPVHGPGKGVYSWPNTNVLNAGHDPNAGFGNWRYGEAPGGFFFGPPW